jgi:hypothetical protein
MGKRIKDTVLGVSSPVTEEPKNKVAEKFGYIPPSSKRGTYDALYEKAAALPNPKTMKQIFENASSLPDSIPDHRQKFYTDAKDELGKAAKLIQDKYEKSSKAAEWAQVGEILGQALTQFAAAHEGLKTGVDISSGLKFSPTDWNAKQQLLLNKLKQRVDEVGTKQSSLEKEESKEVGEFGKERDRIINAQLRKMFEEISAGKKNLSKEEEKESKIDKEANALINKWSASQKKKNQALRDAVAEFESLESKKDTMDEEKYNSAIQSKIAQVARRAGVDARPLLQGWESLQEFGDELPEGSPSTMSEWIANAGNAGTEIEDPRAIVGIKAYVDPDTSVEDRRKIKQKLSSEYGINLP